MGVPVIGEIVVLGVVFVVVSNHNELIPPVIGILGNLPLELHQLTSFLTRGRGADVEVVQWSRFNPVLRFIACLLEEETKCYRRGGADVAGVADAEAEQHLLACLSLSVLNIQIGPDVGNAYFRLDVEPALVLVVGLVVLIDGLVVVYNRDWEGFPHAVKGDVQRQRAGLAGTHVDRVRLGHQAAILVVDTDSYTISIGVATVLPRQIDLVKRVGAWRRASVHLVEITEPEVWSRISCRGWEN